MSVWYIPVHFAIWVIGGLRFGHSSRHHCIV